MKIKTSMKVCYNFKKVFRCGYCELQNILRRYDPTYYNAGVYGWNNDIYVDYTHNIAITTGYRNMRGDRIPSDIIKKYEANAKKILDKAFTEDISEELTANREAFFEELNNL